MYVETHLTDKGYPHHAPRPIGEDGRFRWKGAEGWRLSQAHETAIVDQLLRVERELCGVGWDVEAYLHAERHQDGPIAMLHIVVNGSSNGYTLVDGETFDTVPEVARRWYDLRIIGPRGAKSPGPYVAALVEQLPQHVTDLIQHFARYDGPRQPTYAQIAYTAYTMARGDWQAAVDAIVERLRADGRLTNAGAPVTSTRPVETPFQKAAWQRLRDKLNCPRILVDRRDVRALLRFVMDVTVGPPAEPYDDEEQP
jgi:hypothetical protein